MCPQTSYAINMAAAAYPGQQFDISNNKDVMTGLAVAAAMQYGTLAVTDESNTLGIDQIAVKTPAASGDITALGAQLGVVLSDQARAQNPAVATAQYPINSAVPCLKKGRVWVNAETAVTDGQPVFVRITASGGLTTGSFRNDAAGGQAVALPATQAVWRGTTTGAGFAVLEVDFV